MNAVQIFTFALCIYQISAGTYEETLAACRKEADLWDDKPVDYFFAHGAWPEYTTAGAKCYFKCFGEKLNIIDANGVPNQSKLTEVASQHKEVQELQALALTSSFAACESEAKGPTPCAASENFVKCAIKNAPKP